MQHINTQDINDIKRKCRTLFQELKGGKNDKISISEFAVADYTDYVEIIPGYTKPKILPLKIILKEINLQNSINEFYKKTIEDLGLENEEELFNLSDESTPANMRIDLDKSFKDYLGLLVEQTADKENNYAALVKITGGDIPTYIMYGLKKDGWRVSEFNNLSQAQVKYLSEMFKCKPPESEVFKIDDTYKYLKKSLSENSIAGIMETLKYAHKSQQTRQEAQLNKRAREIIERGESASTSPVAKRLALKSAGSMTNSSSTKDLSGSQTEAMHIKQSLDILASGAAECFGFAMLAYAQVRKILPDLRVQLVSTDVHNFVILGYSGDDAPIKAKNLEKEKNNILIVDLWALAMGISEVDENKQTIKSFGVYTFDQYQVFALRDLNVNMDSKKNTNKSQLQRVSSNPSSIFSKGRSHHTTSTNEGPSHSNPNGSRKS